MKGASVNFCILRASQVRVGMTLLIGSHQVDGWGGSHSVPLEANIIGIQPEGDLINFNTTAGAFGAHTNVPLRVKKEDGDRPKTPMVFLDYGSAKTFDGFSIE